MEHYICTTCGTQFAGGIEPPDSCPVCHDDRQYINPAGQSWTTLGQLQHAHRNAFGKKEKGLYTVETVPGFGIGQRALVIQTEAGNLLWDCISLVDGATVDLIEGIGGLDAIAISHPHYYSSMVEWSKAFGDIPIHLHQDDRQWVMRPDERIDFWEGDTRKLFGDLTLIRCGGHFDGGTVLHWPEGADRKGALLTGDIIQVVPDLRHVTFMYSYPNQIPLPASKVKEIAKRVAGYRFDRIYGAWWNRNILSGAGEAVQQSAERYIRCLNPRAKP